MDADSGRTEADAGDKLDEEHIREVSTCRGGRLIGTRRRIDHVPVRHDLTFSHARRPAPPTGLGPLTRRTKGSNQMRDYEVVYIFHPSLTEEAVNQKLEKFHPIATRSEGAEVTALDHWGARQLAYQVKGESQGYYVVAQFMADPPDLVEFERILKLDEDLFRYLVVLSEGEPTSGMSVIAESPVLEAPERRDDGDEEDDGEEEGEVEEGHLGLGAASPPEFSGAAAAGSKARGSSC